MDHEMDDVIRQLDPLALAVTAIGTIGYTIAVLGLCIAGITLSGSGVIVFYVAGVWSNFVLLLGGGRSLMELQHERANSGLSIRWTTVIEIVRSLFWPIDLGRMLFRFVRKSLRGV